MNRAITNRRSSLTIVSMSRESALEASRSHDRPHVILIRGLPGSGKSTLAREFAANGYRHIEADMYFFVHGRYIFKRTLLEPAHKWCLSATRLALARGERVVVSNVFSKLSEMAPYLRIVDSHVVVELTGTQENAHRVSESAISTMRHKWQPLPS